MNLLPFVGREKLVRRCLALFRDSRNVLVLGPEGIGKTALMRHIGGSAFWCGASLNLSAVCSGLELGLWGKRQEGDLVSRKNHLLSALKTSKHPIMIDGVSRVPPRLARFLETVMERAPLWISARQDGVKEVGHLWPLLWNFVRIEVSPFTLSETRGLIEAFAMHNSSSAIKVEFAPQLHRLSKGNPGLLLHLLEEMTAGAYSIQTKSGQDLLMLDQSICEFLRSKRFGETGFVEVSPADSYAFKPRKTS